jgi:hypothetical protein
MLPIVSMTGNVASILVGGETPTKEKFSMNRNAREGVAAEIFFMASFGAEKNWSERPDLAS